MNSENAALIAEAFGLGKVQRFATLGKHGRINAETGDFFVKYHNSADGPSRPTQVEECLLYQHQVNQHLLRAGVATPHLMQAEDRKPFLVMRDVCVQVWEYLEGDELDVMDLDDLRSGGEALAHMHQALADFSAEPAVGWLQHRKYHGEALVHVGLPYIRNRYKDSDTQPAVRELERLLDRLVNQMRECEGQIQKIGFSQLPWTTIHDDLGNWHLIRGSDGRLAIIDYGNFRRETRVADIAVTLCKGVMESCYPSGPLGSSTLERARIFIKGYSGVIGLLDCEKRALRSYMVIYWILFHACMLGLGARNIEEAIHSLRHGVVAWVDAISEVDTKSFLGRIGLC